MTARSCRVVTPVFLLIACLAGPASLLAQTNFLDDLVFEQLVTGLLRPVAITHAGDGSDRLFITLQDGQIVIYDGEKVLDPPFLDLTLKVSCCNERGLFSVAFHPDYENNGFFYVSYIDRSDEIGDSIISRFRVSDDPNVADPDSEKVLLRLDQPGDLHNAGQLQFGLDGFLYISLGDGGLINDNENNAQRLDTLLGKIVRVDVDGGDPYSIPEANPFFGRPEARGEIWVYGLRNPWRFSFDRVTGDFFIGDVGGGRVEEISFQSASSLGGENYGWRVMEGSECFDPPTGCNSIGLFELPILEYRHDVGCAVIGGYRYRGATMPQLNGVYFYGDLCSGLLFAASESAGQWMVSDMRETGFLITTFGEDESGELYLTDFRKGAIYRLGAEQWTPEQRLSFLGFNPGALWLGEPNSLC